MARVRSRLAGEIMQVGSQDKTQAGVSPRAPSVPPAAASAGRRALKLAVEGGCGGHRWERGQWGTGSQQPQEGGAEHLPMAMGHRQQLEALRLQPEQGRCSGGGEQRQVGVLVLSGSTTMSRCTGKAPGGNPTGPRCHWEFGVSVGYGINRPFPYLRGDGRTGRARRGPGEMPAMIYWQTAKVLSRESHHSSLGSVMLGCPPSDSHLDQTPGTPGRRPEIGLCPSHFFLQQGTVGAQGTPWMDVLFINNHLKVFQ